MVQKEILLDQKTGQFEFTPTIPQTSIIGYLVKEYRKIKGSLGQDSVIFVGSAMRDIQITVSGPFVRVMSVGVLKDSVINATRVDSLNIQVCDSAKVLKLVWRINAINLPLDVPLTASFLNINKGWQDSPWTFKHRHKKDSMLFRDTIWGTFTYQMPPKKVGCYPLMFSYGYCMNGSKTEQNTTINVCFNDSPSVDFLTIPSFICKGKMVQFEAITSNEGTNPLFV